MSTVGMPAWTEQPTPRTNTEVALVSGSLSDFGGFSGSEVQGGGAAMSFDPYDASFHDPPLAGFQSPAEKFLAGPRLFDYACEVSKGIIRRDHPEASEDQIVGILRRRLEYARRMDESE